MSQDEFLNNLFVNYPTKYLPLMPLGLWWDTNRGLENYYDQYGIVNSNGKNKMRHVVGLARASQAYGEPIARMLGEAKETLDFWGGNQDNSIDFANNELGFNFIKQFPNANRKDIMDYAHKKAKEEFGSSLYKKLIE